MAVPTSLGGFEPSTYGLEGRCSIQLSYRLNRLNPFGPRKRVMGIEPTYPAWKAGVLPLNYTRMSIGVTGFEPATSWSQTRRSSQAEPHPGSIILRALPRHDIYYILTPPGCQPLFQYDFPPVFTCFRAGIKTCFYSLSRYLISKLASPFRSIHITM